MERYQLPHIAISGNIGVGKTTLSKNLSTLLGWPVNESDMENPFLNLYYEDMKRWAFHMQMWFLGNRLEWLKEEAPKTGWIQDRDWET